MDRFERHEFFSSALQVTSRTLRLRISEEEMPIQRELSALGRSAVARSLLAFAALIVAALQPRETLHADDTKAAPELKGAAATELVRLRREVDALETLYHLEPTEAQLNGLLALAAKTAAKPAAPAQARAGVDYIKTLRDARAALVRNDEAQVSILYKKLAEIEEQEDAEIGEGFDLTDAALKAAPAALKLFTAAQVVSYLAAMENEVPDPVERIVLALNEGIDLAANEWKSLRDETAEEAACLIHGFHSEAVKGTVKEVTELLERGHRLKSSELEKEIDGLERAARKLAGDVGPAAVLQHYMEREMAEFLSNPEAVAALRARKK
jgi:hypothetical protein